MTSIILAGGASSRTSEYKAFIKFGYKMLIEMVIEKLKPLFEDIIIIANQPDKYQSFGLKIIKDIIPNKGPLAGLYTGLTVSKSIYNFIVSCDMPFLCPELIEYIKKQINGYDIIIPKTTTRIEPLHAIYSKDCLTAIEKNLTQDILSLKSFFSQFNVRYILENEIIPFCTPERAFFNINTDENVEEARVRFANG